MTEYIERERLIGSLEDVIADYKDEHTFSTDFAATVVIDILNNIVKCQPAADVEPVQEWIPVKDRLPEIGRSVIAYNAPAKCAAEAMYKGEGRFLQFRWSVRLQEHEVTHWMPLPPEPQKGE